MGTNDGGRIVSLLFIAVVAAKVCLLFEKLLADE